MGLLDSASVQSGPLTPEQALNRAEALIAAHICPGLPDLSQRTWEAQVRLDAEQRPFGNPLFGRRRLGPELLRYWPITGLLAVVVGGVDVTSECTFDLFSVRRGAQLPEFSPAQVVTVRFQTGWATADEVPPALIQAVQLAQTAMLEAPPSDIEFERIDDHQIKYRHDGTGQGALSPAVTQILTPFRPVLV